jgi:hypothetical protein
MAKDPEEQESRGFKVQDRRRFVDPETHGEEPRPAEEARSEPPPVDAAADASPAAATDADHAHLLGDAAFAEMTFSTFVMGLTTQALMHLGEIPDPVDQQVAHDLPAAKQMIDLLGILRDKTKGNLDAAEDQLLKEVLYDLRMRYVEMTRAR